ncbi:MAG TPA: hypothetical protein VGR06_17840 [Actinophytocola sp.]|uniref:hypothetical protein n=1 Tax=Actinophytocola sp. TaxID=1872138 RepID=UPI002DFC4096|nr:hypothetical protein [Actinophytocola sp.]
MGAAVLNVALSVLAGIIVAALGLALFDTDKLRRRIANRFGLNLGRSYQRINTRTQVINNFNAIFVQDVSDHIGRILLMSHTGGYPEFDPFTRLLEISGHSNLEIHAAITEQTIRAYYRERPEVLRGIVSSQSVKLYTFADLTPYRFRIGINTHLGVGFFCAYYGHTDNRVELEGIRSENPTMIAAIEAMFWGLLRRGQQVTSDWLRGLEQGSDSKS